ncbi:MAG: hypothetical protein Q9228_003196, partial [Teloschistes exilis]
DEYSLLCVARDLISTSPIIFLDEFQLPDRATSKILSNLFTSFFHLGGVLIATSNRMPEELAKASGVAFAAAPTSRRGIFRDQWESWTSTGQTRETIFASNGDFAAFLEVLRARCEIWEMEGKKDWRRHEIEEGHAESAQEVGDFPVEQGFQGLQPMAPGNCGLGYEQSISTSSEQQDKSQKSSHTLPKFYFVNSTGLEADTQEGTEAAWHAAVRHTIPKNSDRSSDASDIPWQSTLLRVYGRSLLVPRHRSGVTYWTFDQLCAANLGPADYISLASTFHTFIITGLPVLTWLHKNEARRLITLLDALYEARCKVLIRGAAGPDNIFFPEAHGISSASGDDSITSDDAVYPETFSEIHQDQTSPFRANVSSYTPTASPPSYEPSPLPSSTLNNAKSVRSILADEDSDFGPTYGGGRSASSRYRGPSDGTPGAGNEIGSSSSPNFMQTGVFTGEDERFAYKRAQSRLWEMCGERWWARDEEGWWRPLDARVRRWEGFGANKVYAHDSSERQAEPQSDVKVHGREDKTLFRHEASPFRTSQDPPPKISWTHAWGMMKWGKKAGAWGRGPEGLEGKRKNFDFGEARLKELSDKTHFPWVLPNVVKSSSAESPLPANAHEYLLREVAGYRAGFFGLARTDWPSNCQHLPPSDTLGPADVARRLARILRVDHQCDFVIAITHMRLVEDLEVADATVHGEARVDLLLGGHDHEVVCRFAGDTNVHPRVITQGRKNGDVTSDGQVSVETEREVRIVKSGTDWRSYSVIHSTLDRVQDDKAVLKACRVEQWTDITQDPAYHSLPRSPTMVTALSSIYDRIAKTVQHPLFHSKVPLDGRSSIIRSQETNLGNLLADAVRAFYNTDIAFVNSGGIRCDRTINPTSTTDKTVLTVKDMIDIFPFDNPVIVKRLPGSALLRALPNSVSDAHTDGRFLQLSGLRITASWSCPEPRRLLAAHHVPYPSHSPIPISDSENYTVAMSSFIAAGFDGYVDVLGYDKSGATNESSKTEEKGGRKKSGAEQVDDRDDTTSAGIARARAAIIWGYDSVDGLPIVNPITDGRIAFREGSVGGAETPHL